MTARMRLMWLALGLLLLLPAVAQAQWETPNRAFHKGTVFPLDGKHLSVPCASCHIRGQVKGTPVACADCHWIRRQDDKYQTRLGMQCEQCHRTSSWTTVKWDHGAQTGMPLNAAHKALGCDTCHKNNLFTGVNLTCGTCHAKDYAATKTPDHKAAGFPTTCEMCHKAQDNSFSQGRFDHNSVYTLAGMHATVDCASCHRNGVYKGTPRECVGCHRTDYERTTQPNHAASGISTDCATCHRQTDSSFRTGNFNHNSVFPLVGLHATQACTACHVNGVYKGTSRDCVGCHRTDYQRTSSPNHAAAGFSTSCDTCHKPTDTAWKGGGTFNHNSVFPLVGLHATQACATCHVNGVYKGTSRDCVGCHRDDYQRTSSPNHAASGFSTSCDSCHKATDLAWKGSGTFNHNSVFPLVGQHATQTCTTCHVNNVFKGTSRDCVGCHRDDYQRTSSPNHAAAGYSMTCDSCHKATDATWRGATFNHAGVFQLVGQHATAACATCHVNNVYKGTPRDCVGCHQTDYQRTTSPNHAAAGYSMTCDSCHKATDATWRGATFNHASVFQLVGQHATAACATCHVNNVYKGTPRDCAGCHQTDYQRTTAPNHAAAGFSTTCDSCHRATDTTWQGGSFNHNTVFQLLGKHATAVCTMCHVNNVYKGTPRTCLPCHQTEYQRTTNPNHIGAGFPTTCETCHTASDSLWSQGRFTHTWFPITSGRHTNISCATCHTNSSAYTQFSCFTGCHNRTETDGHHRGMNGYSYDSNRCYACHPNGRAG